MVTPAALVGLAAACYAIARDGGSSVILVDDDGVRSYLMRAGFVRILGPVAAFQPPMPRLVSMVFDHMRGANPLLIELTRVETGAELPELLDRIVAVLRNRLKYRKHDAFDVAVAVSEICQNTFDHNSDSGTFGFTAMQVYGRHAGRFLEIGVADYGNGLAATLRRNPKNASIGSDLDAIQLATKLGTSEHDDPTRGTGLYHLLEIAYKHEGSIQIRSGTAKARYRMDKRQGWGFTVPAMPGVQIALTLPTKIGA